METIVSTHGERVTASAISTIIVGTITKFWGNTTGVADPTVGTLFTCFETTLPPQRAKYSVTNYLIVIDMAYANGSLGRSPLFSRGYLDHHIGRLPVIEKVVQTESDTVGVCQILDGKFTAGVIRTELADRVAMLKAKGISVGLGTVLVGDDPASHSYVAGKHRDCAEVGIESIRRDLPSTVSQSELEAILDELNEDSKTTGYIVQLPLPAHLDQNAVLEKISPAKDADGLHPTNLGRLVLNVGDVLTSPLPCTPNGIVELLTRHDIALNGLEVLVIGRGVTVGRPLGLLLTRRGINATVTLAHTGSVDLPKLIGRADVVVAAVGVPGIVQANQLKPGAIVLDVGVSRTVDDLTGKATLVGDVASGAETVASWISPNPGGVGPMTRAMLLVNVVESAERRSGLEN